MIDQYFLFACAAIALATIRYGTYFYTIYQGKTKPHAFSWLLWGAVTGVGTLAQFSLNGGPSAWALAFVSITCLIIATISFFIGERDYTKSDWFALITCIIAIPVWHITDSPIIALLLIMTIDALTYWPTIRKSYNKPETEPPISYGFAGMRYFLMLFAVPDPTWQNLMYPFFLMLTDWGFAIYIVIRRGQLGYPLHEYAKEKKTLPAIMSKVTYLEMTQNPDVDDIALDGFDFQKVDLPLDEYIDLYREIGRDYIWNYRPGQTDAEINAVIRSDNTDIYVLSQSGQNIGMAEIDKTDPKNIEIVHFGLLPTYINQGIGQKFFQKVLYTLWQTSVDRIHLSTCGLDHAKAPAFYQNAEFKIFKTKQAEFIDYRFSDFYEMTDAPQIPHGEINA